MPKKWTGDLVGLMHTYSISNIQLANKLGVTDNYVSMILNGHREPEGAEQRFRAALDQLIRAQDHYAPNQVR